MLENGMSYMVYLFGILSVLMVSSWRYVEPKSINLVQEDCLDSLTIAASFTPNNDGKNDTFSINFPCPVQKMNFQILNSWGEVIYSTSDQHFIWTGRDNHDQDLPIGVYFWQLEYTYLDKTIEQLGQVTLIR